MKDPIVLRRDDTLTFSQISYWKDLFYRLIKMGTEVEVAPPKGATREEFEQEIIAALEPSGTFESLGAKGVLDVAAEHCGVEIRVIGRQPHFMAMQQQYSAITESLLKIGSRARPTCGLHFHLLTPTLAEPVPEIILATCGTLSALFTGIACITRVEHLEMDMPAPQPYQPHRNGQALSHPHDHAADPEELRKSNKFLNIKTFSIYSIWNSPTRERFYLSIWSFVSRTLTLCNIDYSENFLLMALTLKAVDLSHLE